MDPPVSQVETHVEEANEFELSERSLPEPRLAHIVDKLGGMAAIVNFPILDASKIKIEQNKYYASVKYSDLESWKTPIMRELMKLEACFLVSNFTL